jgi:hypothetical protein
MFSSVRTAIPFRFLTSRVSSLTSGRAEFARNRLGLKKPDTGSLRMAICLTRTNEKGFVSHELSGRLGTGHSDTIRTIVLTYLSDQGYMRKGGKDAKEC